MGEHEMTPEEMEKFEREQIHHDDDRLHDGGPASEPQIREKKSDRVEETLPPNPD
jgi:hypothetical protein